MTPQQARKFQEWFSSASHDADLDTFFLCGFIRDDETTTQAMVSMRVDGENAQLSGALAHTVVTNLIDLLVRYNGLTPHGAVGALKGMLDEELQDRAEYTKVHGQPQHGEA